MAESHFGYVVALKESVLRELNRTMNTGDYIAEQITSGVARAQARIRAAARRRHQLPVRAHDVHTVAFTQDVK